MDRIATLKRYQSGRDFNRHCARHSIDRQRPHYFLASFPRSGNGWLRMFWADMLLREHGIALLEPQVEVMRDGPNLAQAIRDGEVIYDIRTALPNLYDRQWAPGRDVEPVPAPYTVIKTHHVVPCSTSRAVFLFRDPVPCVISTYQLLNRDASDSDANMRRQIRKVARYYREFLQYFIAESRRYPERCLFLSHDRLLSEPFDELGKLCRFLGHPVENTHMAKALTDFPFKSRHTGLRSEPHELAPDIRAIVDADYRTALSL